MRRSQDDAGTWALICVAIWLLMFVCWLTDPAGQKWLVRFHEAQARSHVNSEEVNLDGVLWGN